MVKKVFVTGAGGFIASHLVEALLQRGDEVTALVHYNSRNHWGWLEPHHQQPPPNLKVVAGDINDPFLLPPLLSGCDTVFHLAALIGIPYSYHAPASYFQTNVMGTMNVVEAARKSGVKRFVHASTSEVYGNATVLPIDENHPLQAQSPYAASKIAADKLIESFVCSYNFPAVVVRPFNTYGPRQSARAVIPAIIAQALQNSPVKVGATDTVRDMTFVSDTVQGFIRASEADGITGHVFNLGTGTGVSIGDLAKTILKTLNVNVPVVTDPARVRPSASEVQRLESNNGKAAKMLGWQPSVSLEDGLRATVDWIRKNPAHYSPKEYAV